MALKEVRILLIEDNPGDARLIQEGLPDARAERFSVTTAGTLREALALLTDRAFDVVLADLNLPDAQELETFARVHASAPHLPVVVLTGTDDETIAIRAVQAGAQDYLVKGRVTGDSVARAVRYAVERQRMQDEKVLAAQLEAARRAQTGHLWQALFTTLGRGAAAILYQAGLKAGSDTFGFVQETWKPRDEGELVRAIGEYFHSAGLGDCRDLRVDKGNVRLDAVVRDGFEVSQQERARDAPSCHFLRGLLCGIAERILGATNLVCEETACQAAGGEACAFVVHPLLG